tara:strand:- start:523 stop:810 length:288 start_codon:yes stop_codon:yes gene_type:complete
LKAAWVVVNTVGDGYSQKYSPPIKVFKRKADAIKYLRGKIKKMIDDDKERVARGYRSYPTYESVAEYIRCNDNFPWELKDTNEGDFWLDRIEVID